MRGGGGGGGGGSDGGRVELEVDALLGSGVVVPTSSSLDEEDESS